MENFRLRLRPPIQWLSRIVSQKFSWKISRELHPGEKKLIKYAEALNLRKPIDFENDTNRILSYTYTDIEQLPALLDETVEKLKKMID